MPPDHDHDPDPVRKLALAFHPDKNKAPGAGEAFKAIGDDDCILSSGQ